MNCRVYGGLELVLLGKLEHTEDYNVVCSGLERIRRIGTRFLVGPPWFNYWFSFTLAYSRISHEYSSLFIIVINLIFVFSL